MFKRITTILTIFALVILVYIFSQNQQGNPPLEDSNRIKEENTDKEEKEKLKYNKEPAYENASFFEEVVIIKEQPMYYAHPLEILQEEPPTLIIYCHGQLQRIVQNFEDDYMKKVREYGEFFASKGFVFSASNQHGDNWGQKESMQDIENSILWFEENNFLISNKIYLIGFSMGGRTAMNYTFQNPGQINKVALLAPTPALEITRQKVESIAGIPIKIWHGTEDVNIPFYTTQRYVQEFKNNAKDIEIIPIEGAGHFDIETTLMSEILEFFKN